MRTRKKKGRSEKGLGSWTRRGANKNFYLRVTIDGHVHTHPTGTNDFEQAKIERDRFLKTLRSTSSGPSNGPSTVTVSELLDDYIDHLNAKGMKDAKGIAQRINARIRPSFLGRLAASITTQDGKNYRMDRKAGVKFRPVGDATVNKELKHLLAAYNVGR
jgi:hypothetical protein